MVDDFELGSAPEAETHEKEEADLWAMWYGFGDAEELKKWGEQAEAERLLAQYGSVDQ